MFTLKKCFLSSLEMRLVIAVASLILLSQAEDDGFSMEKRGSRRYCGTELRRVLMFICDSIYKRGSPDSTSLQDDRLLDFVELEEPKLGYPFHSRARALSVLPEYFRRQTKGVADECCSKACSIDELKTYCGKKPSRS